MCDWCDIIFEQAQGYAGKVDRTSVMQKQPSEGFIKKGFIRNFAAFTKKHLYRKLFFDKVKLCRSATSLKANL